jgi:UDP-N-acetylglucosamine acyltransferase
MLKLADLVNDLHDAEVIRDAPVEDIGYVDSPVANTLAYADTKRHLEKGQQSPRVSSVITSAALAEGFSSSKGLVVSSNPRDLFYRAHCLWLSKGLYRYPFDGGRGVDCEIHASAIISPECFLGDRVKVGPGVIINGPVRVGPDSDIQAGVKLGVDGILFRPTERCLARVRHGGLVEIGRDVTLFAGSTVARSVHPSAPTQVGDGSIVGMNSVVGHDAIVGTCVVISGQCVLARRCRIVDNAYIGTQSFIREHVFVGASAKVMAGSVVIENVPAAAKVSGNHAQPHHRRMIGRAKRLKSEQK